MIEPISNINFSNIKIQDASLNTKELSSEAKPKRSEDDKIEVQKFEEKIINNDNDSGIKEFENKLNEFLKDEDLSLVFKKDEETQKMIMKLVDNKTEEVIKQYPQELSLQIAKMVSGLLEKNSITNIKV